MSAPRQILANKFWMLTRRCTQRMFLLRPDDEMNNAFLYCLIEAALMFQIRLVLPQMMSNHFHIVLHDPKGLIVEFYQRFHTNLAKCVNALRGRWENVLATEPTCLVELADVAAVMDKLVYTATNPVKDGLVEKVHQWPGPPTVAALLGSRTLRARRPAFLFRADGDMPAEVELTLTVPEELGDPDQVREELRRKISAVEAECARERQQSGRSVIGRRRILRQSWRDCPTSHAPRRNLRPQVAARSKWARIERLQQKKREFPRQYQAARALWLEGKPAVFPAGTYWLRVFANVRVDGMADPPPPFAN